MFVRIRADPVDPTPVLAMLLPHPGQGRDAAAAKTSPMATVPTDLPTAARPHPDDPAGRRARTPEARRIRRLRRAAVVLGVVGVVVAARRSGLVDLVSDEQRLRDLNDDLGLLGPIAFTALFSLLVPVGVPGLVFVLPAALVFPAPVAVAVCLVGGYVSSAFGMWAARTVARDRLADRLPARFRAWDERIARRGLPAVIGLRVVTYLAAPADWLLGLTAIPARQLVLGTALGLIPPTLMYVYAGGGLLDLFLG